MTATVKMSRGLRNNNPGNIRINGTKYLGEKTPSTDGAFKQFESMGWGYRAIFACLYTYQKRHGKNTISEMIYRWAPPEDSNHTEAYISRVCKQTGIGPNTNITTTNGDVMIPIAAAISAVENGVPAVMAEVREGWELFLKHRP